MFSIIIRLFVRLVTQPVSWSWLGLTEIHASQSESVDSNAQWSLATDTEYREIARTSAPFDRGSDRPWFELVAKRNYTFNFD